MNDLASSAAVEGGCLCGALRYREGLRAERLDANLTPSARWQQACGAQVEPGVEATRPR